MHLEVQCGLAGVKGCVCRDGGCKLYSRTGHTLASSSQETQSLRCLHLLGSAHFSSVFTRGRVLDGSGSEKGRHRVKKIKPKWVTTSGALWVLISTRTSKPHL